MILWIYICSKNKKLYIHLWIWPLLWKYSSPFNTSLSTVAIVASSKTPCLQFAVFILCLIMSRRLPPVREKKSVTAHMSIIFCLVTWKKMSDTIQHCYDVNVYVIKNFSTATDKWKCSNPATTLCCRLLIVESPPKTKNRNLKLCQPYIYSLIKRIEPNFVVVSIDGLSCPTNLLSFRYWINKLPVSSW